MEQRLAILAIVVENPDSVEQLNALLHEYRNVIIGRMGVPYPKREVSLVSVALDAPMDVVSALSGKVGRLPGVTAKAAVSKVLE